MIKPEFSEFTFGYAFTENFTNGWLGGGVRSVPIFPSLLAEGRPTGGYDVAIPTHAEPILFQFKIPQLVTRRSRLLPPAYWPPYYRMHLEPGARSAQHRALLQHARAGRRVFYVAPCFDRMDILDNHYRYHQVPDQCAYFSPDDIGVLDDEAHFVAYQRLNGNAWLFSEPKETAARAPEEVRQQLREIARTARPVARQDDYFSELSSEIVRSIESAVELRLERRPREAKVDRTVYVYEELRKVDSRDLLWIARSTETIDDPLARFVQLATFVLNCHVVLVGTPEAVPAGA